MSIPLPEFDQTQFDELYEMVQENNEMLRAQGRTSRLKSLGNIVKLIALLALVIGGIMFLHPYLQNAKKIYESVQQNIETVSTTAQNLEAKKVQTEEFLQGFSDEFQEMGVFFEGIKKPEAPVELEVQG